MSPAVEHLSEGSGSENESVGRMPEVDALSDEDQSCRPKRKRQKQDNKVGVVERLQSEREARLLVGQTCPCKHRNCFEQFRPPADFEPLFKYRSEWDKLEKLDQDTVASCLHAENLPMPV